MIAYQDFIVHIPFKFKDQIKLESGLELYADRRFSAKELSNTKVEVIETPLGYNGPIKKGDMIFIDPSVMMLQVYNKTGEQESQYVIDRNKNLYQIPENFIIAYHSNDNGWKCYKNNILTTIYKTPKPKSKELNSGLIIPDSVKNEDSPTYKIYANNNELDIEKGVIVYVDKLGIIDVWLDGKQLQWLRNKDIIALA